MIHGTGIDIVEIDRIRQAFSRFGDKILNKVFTAEEIGYCKQKQDPFPCLAARFAVKEALIKALDLDAHKKVNMREIELYGNSFGKKRVIVHGKIKQLAEQKQIQCVHVSISHEKRFAVAQIILER